MKELDTRDTESEGEPEDIRQLRDELAASADEISTLREALEETRRGDTRREDTTALTDQVAQLEEALAAEKKRAKEQWKWSCSQVSELDALVANKEEDIFRLQTQLEGTRGTPPVSPHPPAGGERETGSMHIYFEYASFAGA